LRATETVVPMSSGSGDGRFVERERVKWQRLAQLEGEPRSAVNVKIRDRLKRWETSEGVADSRESSRHFPG
jgi:hypothetical protein